MATLEQIQAKMDKLKAQAEALAAKNAQAIVDKIRGLMLQHGLTTKDIEADAKTKRAAKTVGGKAADAAKASKKSGVKVAAKYQDPKTGATWTGRGRAPAWIASAKDRSKFLIGSGASAVAVSNSAAGKVKAKADVKAKGNASASAVKKASTAGAATAPKGQQKADQAPRYRDPKSGATWSGRGRAPLWIAGAKDRNKFLIDAAQAVAPVAKTNKPKAVVTKAVVAKTNKPKAAVTKAAVAKTNEPKAVVTKAAVAKTNKPKAVVTKAAVTKAAVTKAPVTKAAATKAPAVKKVSAVKEPGVVKSPVADEKVVAKKAAVSPAKPKAVKKVVAKKADPVAVVAASSDVPAAPVASAEVAA
ncbi:DNA-binding protein H-NS [Paraburkholderia fungorum]|uniref:DNA-binding protein H-NS n=1 Tax=Paraburkholderia fungorum TaxID=134537 RepID=A0A1H1HGQ0_9BURK|nr:H-NS family nucleoid-associated regulatory protein [Paraburkholderia fungorum]SDR24557.1 DNA-binding protein H-NS [Paraburkholderia fungorum]